MLLSLLNPAMPGLLAILAPLEMVFVLFPSTWFNWLAVPAALGPPFTVATVEGGVLDLPPPLQIFRLKLLKV
jgi:hypothetical protein